MLKVVGQQWWLASLTNPATALLMGCLVVAQNLYTPSHRMFEDMYKALNIDKKITNCIVYTYFLRRIF
jgi:hypothetical protein